MSMMILGLSSFKDDSAAALLRDGRIDSAIENRKLQPWVQPVPEAAIRFCLNNAKASWANIDVTALATNPARGWIRRALSRSYVSVGMPMTTIYQEGREIARYARDRVYIRSLRQRMERGRRVLPIDHHLCHAASAFFLSPFDKALILTLDGEGDGNAGMIALGQGNKIRVRATVPLSDSVGRIYSRITHVLGFAPSKEEYKTQWLSLEGTPAYKEVFTQVLRDPDGKFPRVRDRYFRREFAEIFTPSSLFWKELGLDPNQSQLTLQQKRDIASSLQAALTELIYELLTNLQERTAMERFCLGGGVFQNTLLVGALERRLGIGSIFVPPAPGNAGSAVGAATWVWHQGMNNPRKPDIWSVYWGPSYTRAEIKEVLDNVKAPYALLNTAEKKIESAIRLLRAGKIVGWFHGATEFGPRALGHRSILASPWAPYVTENLNDFVKHRESFRPFAVSIREEDCSRYFVASPLCRLMNSLGCVRPETNVLPQALQLAGGFVRLHIVQRHTDAMLWDLLIRFGEDAPAPILVNTSFNLPGEPAVVRPRDAVRTFFCSGIDALFVDNFLVTKSSAAHVLADRPG